ncbi:uncharacterized protein LOC141844519 [Curcuma longa]|uniref:uncharacterized protein LOC141844519 n=1 Tax=Curcuma longa TaxID=136217 RepID=UPI003D9E393F
MAEDLRLPAELLDDGFFHGFFVDDNDKVRDLLNEATGKRAAEEELWHRLPNQMRNPSPFLAHRQLQAARIRHLKQQQLLQQQFWLAGHCPSSSPSRRAPFLVRHQPLPASGMTAVFLSSSGARKEPTGTGVFLPRTSNSKPQPQKKSVLLPARVVPAPPDQNANFTQPEHNFSFLDSFMGRRRRSPQPGGAVAAIRTPMSCCLPQEWTY